MQRTSGRYLVTGATGFLGAHVVAALLDRGFESVGMARERSNTNRLHFLCPKLPAENLFRADLGDVESLESAIANFAPDAIVHCAAYGVNYLEQDPKTAYRTNVIGTLNLLSSCEGTSVRKIVTIGTSYEYGDQPRPINLETPFHPCNLYGKSKLEQTRAVQKYAKKSSLTLVNVRPFTMFGPAEGEHKFLPLVSARLLSGGTMELTLGEQLRNYVYVRDAASYLCDTLTRDAKSLSQINLYSGDNLSLRQFGTLVADQIEHRGILEWGSKPYRENEIMRNYADNRSSILVNQTSINTAIAETVEQNRLFADA